MSPPSVTLLRLLLLAAVAAPAVAWDELLLPTTVPPAVAHRALMGLVACGLIWMLLVERRTWRDGRDPVLLSLTALLLVLTASALLGDAPLHSLYSSLSRMYGVLASGLVLLFYLAARAVLDQVWWKRLFFASYLTSVVIGLVMIGQALEPGRKILWVPPSAGLPAGTFGNSGLTAVYLLVSGFLGVWLLLEATSLRARLVVLAGLVVLTVAFFLPANLSSFLALTAVIGWVVVRGAVRGGSRGLVAVTVVAALLGGGIGVAIAFPDSGFVRESRLLARLTSADGLEQTLGVRVNYMAVADDGFRERPLLGVGPENFGLVFDRYHRGAAFEQLAASYEDRAHNLVVELATTTGALGGLAFLGVVFAIGRNFVAARRKRLLDDVSFVILAATGICYLVYLQLWFQTVFVDQLVIAAAAYSRFRETGIAVEIRDDRAPAPGRMLFGLAASAVVLFFTYQHTLPLVRAAYHARQAVIAPTFDGAAGAYGEAVQTTAPETAEVSGLFARYVQDFGGQVRAIRRDTARVAVVTKAIAQADSAVARQISIDPMNVRWRMDRGDLYLVAALLYDSREWFDAAMGSYQEAAQMSPRRLTPRYKEVLALLTWGEPAAADRLLEELEAANPEAQMTHLLRARVSLLEGDYDRAEAALSRAWAFGILTSDQEPINLVERRLQEENWASAARIAREYLEFRFGYPQPAGPTEFVRQRAVPMADLLPILYLRLGRDAEALEAAGWLGETMNLPGAVQQRFEADLAAGYGEVWARYSSYGKAATRLGALHRPLSLDRTAR